MRSGFMRFALIAVMVMMTLASCAEAAAQETILHRFQRTSGAAEPLGTLAVDKAGNFYAVTTEGGNSNCGVLFELSPASGGGWSYSVIHEFTGPPDCYPNTSLAIDATGKLYGVTEGEIYELSPDGTGNWTESILYTAKSRAGGLLSGLVIDTAGNLYGTAGYDPGRNGFVYELSPSNGTWKMREIYQFNGTDGSLPASVIVGGVGNLYGTTVAGGSSTNCTGGCGVVFELTRNGGTWSENVLLDFDGTNGSEAGAPLTIDSSGNLYGTAETGGASGYGLVLELTQSGGVWTQNILHEFTDTNGDGSGPVSGVILINGDVYGTTIQGGTSTSCSGSSGEGCGALFKLTPSGNTWNESIVHSFGDTISDGAFPWGLFYDANGHVYGVTTGGGSWQNGGSVYEMSVK